VPSIASVYVDILPVTGKIADGIAKALLGVDDDVRQAAPGGWRRDIARRTDRRRRRRDTRRDDGRRRLSIRAPSAVHRSR
jgi:hypothetical protein